MRRPLRPCSVPGCPGLTDRPGGCAAHQNRGQKERYGPRWEAFAASWLSTHPWCADCGVKRARQVHHPVSVRVAPQRQCDPTNAVALCHTCHARRHVNVRATTGQDRRRTR